MVNSNHPLGTAIKNCNPSSHRWPLKWRVSLENGGSHLWWRLLCWPGPARPGYSVVPLLWGRESRTSGRSTPQTLWCLSPWQHLDNEEGGKRLFIVYLVFVSTADREPLKKVSLLHLLLLKTYKTCIRLTESTWDDEKDFPSSFVHDQSCHCCEDDLNRANNHWGQVTLLMNNKVFPAIRSK